MNRVDAHLETEIMNMFSPMGSGSKWPTGSQPPPPFLRICLLLSGKTHKGVRATDDTEEVWKSVEHAVPSVPSEINGTDVDKH